MGQILKDIYTDVEISSLVGFKGGTCAYFFYELPRFSVDLDFDLLSEKEEDKKIIFEKIGSILKKYGSVRDLFIKKFTIYFMLSYGDADHNIKIEINTRKNTANPRNSYEMKEYLGIPVLVAKPDYLFACKLVALTERKQLAMRDVYDIFIFGKKSWNIDPEPILVMTGKSVKKQLEDCIEKVEKIKESQMLQGIGELLGEEEKKWVKQNLKKEAIFMMKNYMSIIGNRI
jgi:predicted nucleotidyltransferase component of viral defense system